MRGKVDTASDAGKPMTQERPTGWSAEATDKLSVDDVKKIVPFTDDNNLVDARIDTLKSLDLKRGGTSLDMAIQQSLQYFITESSDIQGNILVITDGEETESIADLKIPKGI